MSKKIIAASKFLSLILRHNPQKIALDIDDGGWVDVDSLLEKSKAAHVNITKKILLEVVEKNDKQRFSFNDDLTKIRANQGHSIPVNLGLEPISPPDFLFHGTAIHNLESIKKSGILPGKRQNVHLSTDEKTALKVGRRHGIPVLLQIDAWSMHREGGEFYLSVNGVWLTNSVPSRFIRFTE